MTDSIRKKIENEAKKHANSTFHPDSFEDKRVGFISGAEFHASLLSNDEAGLRWVSVKDALPLEDVQVLVVTDNNEVAVGRRTKLLYIKSKNNVQWVASGDVAEFKEIIFWMPFPKSPQK